MKEERISEIGLILIQLERDKEDTTKRGGFIPDSRSFWTKGGKIQIYCKFQVKARVFYPNLPNHVYKVKDS